MLQILSPTVLAVIMVAAAGFLLVLGMALPKLQKETLQKRLAKVAIEHGGTKAMAFDKPLLQRMAASGGNQNSFKQKYLIAPLARMTKDNSGKLQLRLKMAGFRGNSAMTTYLMARLFLPAVLAGLFLFYGTAVLGKEMSIKNVLIMLGAGGALGYFLPPMLLSNRIQKRQKSIQGAWPDALDLLLICVEAGYGIDAALMRLADEMGARSPELAEEISLTALELSYLQDRAKALDNLVDRTGLEQVRHVVGSLKQTERYGTDLGRALRVHAQESRDLRLEKAKQKAAALPPKLTAPMILFFLPILFVILISPAVIQIVQG